MMMYETSIRLAAPCVALLFVACATVPPPTTPEVVAEALPETTRIPEAWQKVSDDRGER